MSSRGRWAIATAIAGLAALVSATAAGAAPAGQIEYADCYTSQADACGPGKSAIPKFGDASDVAVAPDGRQVYVTSLGDDSITRFDRDPATGALTRAECLTGSATGCGVTNSGKPGIDGPSAVAVSADGRGIYLANRDSNSIVALRREPSGALTYLGCVSPVPQATLDCGSGNNSKPGLDIPVDLAVSADGKAVAVAANNSKSMAYLSRDVGTGALTYGGCFSQAGGADCAAAPAPGLDGATGIDVSPDSRNIYVASFTSKAIARFSRDPDSGAIAYVGANTDPSLNSAVTVAASGDGRNVYATSVQTTHAVSAFERQGDSLVFHDCFDAGAVCGAGRDSFASLLFPYGLSVAADGRSVYTVHLNGTESTISRFDRDPRDGSLSRVGCFTSGTGCGPGNDAMNQLRGMLQVDTSPDGRDVYAASTGALQLVRFRRAPDEPPACAPPPAVAATAGTPVTIALGCADANADAFSVGFPAGPGHGSLAPGGGSVAYTPAAGYTGPDSFMVQAVDVFGTPGPVSTVAVTVSPLPGGQAPDVLAPTVLGFTMPRTLRAAARGGSVTRTATAIGARVRYTLSEPATTIFTVERKTVGRRSGRRCVKATRRNRKARRCTLYVLQRGSFTHQGAAGANSFKFSGRLRNRKLAVGSYRLVAVAADAAGNRSAAKRRAFRIVRR